MPRPILDGAIPCDADVADVVPSLRTRTDELRSVREAMRDFGTLLTELEEGKVEKLVLT